LAFVTVETQADTTASREYQIKAAFLYNFIMFTDWPKEKMSDDNEPIIIGIIGKDPFGDAFEPVKDKNVKGKNVVIELFKGLEELKEADKKNFQEHPQIDSIKKCHVLFISSSEKKWLSEVIDGVKDNSILTVTDTEGFIEAGGIINFTVEEKKVGFEVNLIATEKAKLKISSKLLRLAKRVIKKENKEES
jgi:hypothetical protein